jgi:hypothetical protein
MDAYQVPMQFCPKCDEKLDGVSTMDDMQYRPPESGDITICAYCATILVYDTDAQLVDHPQLVAKIMNEIAIEEPETARAMQEMRQMILRRKINS